MTARTLETDVSRYSYRVSWSPEDDEFVATCAEFPSLSWLAPTQIAALEGIESVVEQVLQDLLEAGDEVPEPWSQRAYSGKFNLRVGERLHRSLAQAAAEQGLSLNQYVVRLLTPGHT
jgi:predicted HicB family RNase H-like nuclease